jgi:beta-lactamase regulating signal transducer with metallopeptidase domain
MSAPVILWVVLLAALAILFAYRKFVESSVDELVHVSDVSNTAITKQQSTAKQLDQLDRLVKILAILVVLYGIGMCCMYVYTAFASSGRVTP